MAAAVAAARRSPSLSPTPSAALTFTTRCEPTVSVPVFLLDQSHDARERGLLRGTLHLDVQRALDVDGAGDHLPSRLAAPRAAREVAWRWHRTVQAVDPVIRSPHQSRSGAPSGNKER